MITITIDGPSGTGKTTVAKQLAASLKFVYFDTGAMYRALTWWIAQHHISEDDAKGIDQCLDTFDFKIVEKGGRKHYYVGASDVTEAIRSPAVTQRVSAISALKTIRSRLLPIQHRFAQGQNVVFEGRDLGTVVFPQATFKVFLTADPRIRAERRLQELLQKDPDAMKGLTHEQVLQDLIGRDEQDSRRAVAPLKCPEGAFIVDTTRLTIDQVVTSIATEYYKRCS